MYDLREFIQTYRNLINARKFNDLYDILAETTFGEGFSPITEGKDLVLLFNQNSIDIFKEASKENILSPFLISSYINALHLESIEIPSNISELKAHSFNYCSSLKQIDLSRTKIAVCESNVCVGCHNLESIKLPVTVKSIERRFLIGPNNMRKISIPDGCEYVKSAAFAEVNKVKEVFLPASLQKFNSSCVIGHAFTPKKLIYYYDGANQEISNKVAADNLRRTQL